MAFRRLSETDDWQVTDESQDIRGRELISHDGRLLGTISDMIVDTELEMVDRVVLDNGREFAATDLDFGNDRVILKESRRMAAGRSESRTRIGCSRIYPSRG